MVYTDNRYSYVTEERCLFSMCHPNVVISCVVILTVYSRILSHLFLVAQSELENRQKRF